MINDYTFGYAIIFVTFDFLSFQLSGFVTQYRLLLLYLSLLYQYVIFLLLLGYMDQGFLATRP